ncbi:RNA polymerase primary sigma factor [Natranaerovirga hydrolytica]|uniref:RNA polymerase primary sigma factor n=1 Tax=Natranaerovirga hydrolytica TaxID=680378 RepID=A0A4R1MC23_9FIRM|nr:sigma-70 family RNA polymerase sigma factor [Natranaerovirga hydrolytica]TCK89122.1 RNA polymerase primary sigma factor [Natranaerovirga hydrolytica]
MGSAGSHQIIIDKLYTLYKQKGYLREDEALDLMTVENTSLVGINRITDKLIELGVIFAEDSSSDDDDEYDRAQVDYDSVYEEILSISPGQERFVNYLREIKPPQHREWQQLVTQMSSGNDYAYNRLFEMYLRVVARIALRYAKDETIELDDAIQEGAMGLMRAIKQFDPSQHGNLGSYLPLWIQQYVSRAIADKGRTIRIPVHMLETVEKIRKSKEKLIALHGTEPCFELLSIETGIPTEQLGQIVSIIRNTSDLLSTEELVNDTREDSVLNRNENSYSIEDDVTYIFLRRDLAEIMQTLKPRETKVLSMRFGLLDGLEHTLEEVGSEFAITRERVRQIEVKALKKMRHPSRSKKLKDYI